MRIAITGACGFVGSHLVDALGAHELVLCDNMTNNCIPVPLEVRAEHDFQFFPERYSPLDFIIHCASPVGPALIRSGDGTLQNIVRGAWAAIQAAERCNAKLILFSSSEAGDAECGYLPMDARSEYALGKYSLECMALSHPYQQIQILRPHNVVGPRQRSDGGFVLPRFIEQAKRGEPLTIFGTGEQWRSFLSVHDLVDLVLKLIERWPDHKHLLQATNPENHISINRLAKMISDKTVPATPGYRDRFGDGDSTLYAQTVVDWKPEWDLKRIIEELL